MHRQIVNLRKLDRVLIITHVHQCIGKTICLGPHTWHPSNVVVSFVRKVMICYKQSNGYYLILKMVSLIYFTVKNG